MKALLLASLLLAPPSMKESEPGLLAQAKVTPETARKKALAQVKGGRVKAEEIERENGRLIYSFDIEVKGKSGIDEVAIDAKTGAVVGRQHEAPADEAKEAAQDTGK